MRWRSREEPWAFHQSAARALKWETSSGLTDEKLEVEDVDEVVEWHLEGGVVVMAAQYRGNWERIDGHLDTGCDRARCLRRTPAGRVGADMVIGCWMVM